MSEQFIVRLKELTRLVGSARRLAAAAGISHGTLNAWLKGNLPSGSKSAEVEKALGLTHAQFRGEEPLPLDVKNRLRAHAPKTSRATERRLAELEETVAELQARIDRLDEALPPPPAPVSFPRPRDRSRS